MSRDLPRPLNLGLQEKKLKLTLEHGAQLLYIIYTVAFGLHLKLKPKFPNLLCLTHEFECISISCEKYMCNTYEEQWQQNIKITMSTEI